MEIEVLEIVRTERQFGNDEVNVLVFQLQLLEHLDQVLFRDSLLPVFDVLKCCLQFLGVGAGHLGNPDYHLLLLFLRHQLEIVDYLA